MSITRLMNCLLRVALFAAAPQFAMASGEARQCFDAIRNAAANSGVPEEILLAVAITESGRNGSAGLEPWPWALNQGGEGMWFETRESALTTLVDPLPQGVTNIDIGCFQLNWRWHGDGFASVPDMIDPGKNAAYAAEFLLRLRHQTGSWEKAVAGYHSFTPRHATRYMERFRPVYASLTERADLSGPLLAEGAEGAIRQNNYPLLQLGQPQSAGSLVSLAGARKPLLGMQ